MPGQKRYQIQNIFKNLITGFLAQFQDVLKYLLKLHLYLLVADR